MGPDELRRGTFNGGVLCCVGILSTRIRSSNAGLS